MHYALTRKGSRATAESVAMNAPAGATLCGAVDALASDEWRKVDCPACLAARYQVTPDGTAYNFATPPAVVSALESARRSGERVRVFYGETATGAAWAEEHDVSGTVGRSGGSVKIPLIIANARSMGLLDSCIVAIRDARGWRYRHPAFTVGTFELAEVGGARPWAVRHNGQSHAAFTTEAKAKRWLAFMCGERLAA